MLQFGKTHTLSTTQALDEELSRTLQYWAMQETIIASMLPMIRSWDGKPFSDFLDARDASPGSTRYTTQAVERFKTYSLSRSFPTDLSDNPRIALREIEQSGRGLPMTSPGVEVFPIGDDLATGQALMRFFNQLALRQQIREHYRQVGREYGALITRTPSLGNGLYVVATTTRRDATGWMVSTSRSKSSYQIHGDPMNGVLWGAPSHSFYGATSCTVDSVWESFRRSFIHFRHSGPDLPMRIGVREPQGESQRFNTSTADLVVLLPRAEASQRQKELAPIRSALIDISKTWEKRRNKAVNWGIANRDLMKKYTKTNERLKTVFDVGSDEWKDMFRYNADKEPLVTEFVTALEAALEDETLDRVRDHVRARAWTQAGGALTEDEQKEIASVDWDAFDDNLGQRIWDAYVADNPLKEITY